MEECLKWFFTHMELLILVYLIHSIKHNCVANIPYLDIRILTPLAGWLENLSREKSVASALNTLVEWRARHSMGPVALDGSRRQMPHDAFPFIITGKKKKFIHFSCIFNSILFLRILNEISLCKLQLRKYRREAVSIHIYFSIPFLSG